MKMFTEQLLALPGSAEFNVKQNSFNKKVRHLKQKIPQKNNFFFYICSKNIEEEKKISSERGTAVWLVLIPSVNSTPS